MRFFISEFIHFGFKQAYACLFGGAMLFLILCTKFFWPHDATLARYDFLFIMAIAIQSLFILFKLESLEEVKVIFIFHIVGTIMEIFKTHVGSWIYPEPNLLRIGGVPLYSGFMYSAVGSYIARVWRIFDFRFSYYPPTRWTIILCAIVYANFFTHHYIMDLRYALFALILYIYGTTQVHFKPNSTHHTMPLLIGFGLVSFFIWIAENIGTFGAIWSYPNQHTQWHLVSLSKMGSWYLLMIISFVLVSLLHKPETLTPTTTH